MRHNIHFSTISSQTRLISVFAVLTIVINVNAQTWLKDNQTWQYQVYDFWNPDNEGLHSMKVDGDTILQGKSCKIVTHYMLSYPSRVFYAYEEQNRVFVYKNNSFVKIYDFNLSEGDTVALLWGRKYKIDSVGIMQIDNIQRQFQHINYYGTNWTSPSYLVIEGIGLVGSIDQEDTNTCSYFFLEESYCDFAVDGWNVYFRCFSDEINFYHPNGECAISGTSSPFEEHMNLMIYPNPTNNSFILDTGHNLSGSGILTLYNSIGQNIKQIFIEDLRKPLYISIQDLGSGVYYALLMNKKTLLSGKVIVEK